MKQPLRLILASLVVLVGVHGEGISQETTDPQADVGPGTGTITPDEIPIPPQLAEKFEHPEEAPLELGDATDRVRELQASLNLVLKGDHIKLTHPVGVGPALGSGKSARDKVRLVYSDLYDMAFQIRGNWVPCDQNKKPLADPSDGNLKETSFLLLPDEPLKVDGVYGQHTQAAVAVFQLQQALPVTGKVDVVTLDKLEPMVPTNPVLAAVMRWVSDARIGPFYISKEDDDYAYWVKTCTSVIVMLFILLASAVLFQFARVLANSTRFLSRWLFTPSSSPWFTALRKNNVFLISAQFAPALFIYAAAIAIFPDPDPAQDARPYLNIFQDWQNYTSHLGLAYVSLVMMLVAFAVAKTFDSIFNPDEETASPIGGIVRASQRLIGLTGTLLICASLAGRSPFYLVGGLGAFTAVFMLVFRDYVLGIVASVQIIANNVVKLNDWVTMPKYNADGDVKEISLSLIKVQNFDKTLSTIPTNAVLSESFRNWTGMQTSGGRRIKRAILIDMHSIQVCTPDMIGRFEKIELIRDYIQGKKAELEEYNRTHDIDASTVNSRRLTNIGTFRAYLEAYLSDHAGLSSEMTFLVRHLQSTSNGLPIEIYAFCKETAWTRYEAVQADIFDHVLAVLPEFGLQTFQEITDVNSDLQEDLWSPELKAALAEIEDFIAGENRDLSDNPRRRLSPRLNKVKNKIAELGLAEHVDADGFDNTIYLRHFKTD